MVTAGVLIELAGYVGDRTGAGEATSSYTSARPPDSAAGNSENAPLPAPATAATTRPTQATVEDPYLLVHYLYRAIANGSATGCAVFSPVAAQEFAAHFAAPDRRGPPLSRFTLHRTDQDKWYISEHETETC